MANEIRVPTLGESVTEATIGRWFKKLGDAVKADEPLVELETDKATLEVESPVDATAAEIVAETGAVLEIGAVLARLDAEGDAAAPSPRPTPVSPPAAPPPPASICCAKMPRWRAPLPRWRSTSRWLRKLRSAGAGRELAHGDGSRAGRAA